MINQASVERAADLFRAPEGSFDRLIRRRDRKRRNQRIGVFVLVAAIAAAGLFAAVSQLRTAPVPADENPAPVGNGEIVMVKGLFRNPDTNPELVAVDPETGAVRRLVTCDQECSVSAEPWSPDGKKLLYSSGGSSYVLDIASGSSRALMSGRSGDGTFSPDGRQIAYRTLRKFAHGFFVTGRDGNQSRKLDPLSGLQLWWYQWSPDGRSIEYFQHAVYSSDGSIGILDLEGTPTSRTLVSRSTTWVTFKTRRCTRSPQWRLDAPARDAAGRLRRGRQCDHLAADPLGALKQATRGNGRPCVPRAVSAIRRSARGAVSG